jgi:hypothetical protein
MKEINLDEKMCVYCLVCVDEKICYTCGEYDGIMTIGNAIKVYGEDITPLEVLV